MLPVQAAAEMKEKIGILQNEIEILQNETTAKDKALAVERQMCAKAIAERDAVNPKPERRGGGVATNAIGAPCRLEKSRALCLWGARCREAREKRLQSPFALHSPHTVGYAGVSDQKERVFDVRSSVLLSCQGQGAGGRAPDVRQGRRREGRGTVDRLCAMRV